MAFILTKDKGQRMWGGKGSNISNQRGGGGGSGAGGGGGGGVSSSWVDDNYVSKDYFNQLFKVKVAVRVLVTDPSTTPATVVSDTTTVRQDLLYPNEVPEPTETTDEETGYVTSTTYAIDSIQVMGGLWTNSYLSALGQNSSGSGGGGGSLNEPLSSINMAGLSAPGAAQDGQTVVWNQATGRWVYGSTGSGTVTSITAGTGLSGGTITDSGTIAIDSTYQTYISHGETAYGWGNHATAGYMTQSAGDNRYLKIDFFRSLFRAYTSGNTEVTPNAGDTATIDNIKAMFGFWTNAYISALGQNSSGGGGGGSSTLAGLNDVALDPDPLTSANANDVLTYDGTGHWINTSKSSFLSGYATQTWVTNQGYLTDSDLTGYATQSWVTSQNYLTGITSSMVTTALGYTPLSNATTFWGQSANNGVVSGSMTNVGDITMNGANRINPNGNALFIGNSNNASWVYMADMASQTGETYWKIYATGYAHFKRLYLDADVYLEYDSTNGGVQLVGAGFYTSSYVSALGANSSGGGGGGGSSTLAGLNDVALDPDPLTSANANDVLTYDGTGHWINTSKSSFLSGYVTTSDISDMATQTWVTSQGYLTSSDISDMATQTWVTNQGYTTNVGTVTSITAGTGLSGGTITGSGTIAIDSTYQTYISHGETAYGWGNHANAGYLTGITSSQVTTALGYTPLSNSTTFWGQSVSSGVVQGSIEAGLVGGAITGFHSIELNSHGTLSDYGGFIDFHYNGISGDYTSRIIEDANGRLFMDAVNGVRIGDAVMKWDSTNNALYVQRSDGSAVNLYATGGVSALGMSAGTSSVDAMTFNYVTINSRLTLPSGIIAGTSPMITRQSGDSDCVYLFYADAESKISSYSYYYNQYDNVGLRGTNYNFDEQWWIDPDGCARFQRLYLDSTRYLYVSGGTLYYYNGTTSKQVAFTN